MQPFRRISHNLRFVSPEPELRKSPYGWKSMHFIPDLCPVSVRTSLAASRSQIFKAPDVEPAHTNSSVWPNRTHSMGVVWPLKLCKVKKGKKLIWSLVKHSKYSQVVMYNIIVFNCMVKVLVSLGSKVVPNFDTFWQFCTFLKLDWTDLWYICINLQW